MSDNNTPITDPAVTPEGNDAPVTFDERQQSKINALLRKEREAAERKAIEKFEADKAALASEIAELKKPKSNHGKPGEEDPEALKGKLAEAVSLLEATKGDVKRWQTEAQLKAKEAAEALEREQNVQKTIALTNAAQKAKFRNVDHAVNLTQGNVKWDAESKQYIVIGEHGQPRLNAAMEPMSLDEFYTDFANKNKYMVIGDLPSGMGATPSNGSVSHAGLVQVDQIFGPKSSGKLSQEVYKSDPALWHKLKNQAVAQGLLAA